MTWTPEAVTSRRSLILVLVPFVLAAALLVVACGGENGGTASPSPTATHEASPSPQPTATTGGGTTTVLVYFLRGEKLGTAERRVPETRAVAQAAMTALCGGPTRAERAAGLGTAVPAGTELLGVSIDGTTATVDLSGEYASGGGSLSMMARVAQVVYALTQFKTVRAVELMLDGKPLEALGGEGIMLGTPQRRADWDGFEPPIFVERPGVGAIVASPFVVQGRATVFEATVNISLLDADGSPLVATYATATMGAPGRGSFSKAIRFTHGAGHGWVVAYEASAKDGSHLNEVRVPVTFAE